MRGGTWLVDPEAIDILWAVGEHEPSRRNIEYQKKRLQTEGQIVPLEVDLNGFDKECVDNRYYPYAKALLMAARELKWETVLVTDDHS
jgi:hypothetical protein